VDDYFSTRRAYYRQRHSRGFLLVALALLKISDFAGESKEALAFIALSEANGD
jgi:hypothetical protein